MLEDRNQTNASETVAKKEPKQARARTKVKPTQKSGKKAGKPPKPFPSATFESVLPLANVIFENAGASRESNRKTVFSLLNKSAESGPSRMLVINSAKYGLTIGGKRADIIKITDEAVMILDQNTPMNQSIAAKFKLAIASVPVFLSLYEKFKGGKLPAVEVMKDALDEVAAPDKQDCVEIFVGNAKYVGLLRTKSGAEHMLTIEELTGEFTSEGSRFVPSLKSEDDARSDEGDFDSICFFMAPIGDEGTPQRKHSDMILETLVEHAIKPTGMKVVRADKITKPGMISKQIVEHIIKSKLVVVDLSFHNPNVFYELAIRHLLGKPVVHLIRKSDHIPFDVGSFRTIQIDDGDMYDFIAKIESYRAEISNFIRESVGGTSSADNPVLSFFPGLKFSLVEGQV